MSSHLPEVYFSRWFLMPHLDTGVTATTCMRQFVTNGDYTESEVWDAIHSLVNDGHIFETSQKHTFRHSGSSDLRELVLHFIKERGTSLHCVCLCVMSVSTFYHKSSLPQTTKMKMKESPLKIVLLSLPPTMMTRTRTYGQLFIGCNIVATYSRRLMPVTINR